MRQSREEGKNLRRIQQVYFFFVFVHLLVRWGVYVCVRVTYVREGMQTSYYFLFFTPSVLTLWRSKQTFTLFSRGGAIQNTIGCTVEDNIIKTSK